MSQFYGEVRGSARTVATRRGNRSSGLSAHIRGWDVGVQIVCQVIDGVDVIEVYRTGGSNDPRNLQLLARIEQ